MVYIILQTISLVVNFKMMWLNPSKMLENCVNFFILIEGEMPANQLELRTNFKILVLITETITSFTAQLYNNWCTVGKSRQPLWIIIFVVQLVLYK